jgi:DNA gyrase/topoisomerase IV subunit B
MSSENEFQVLDPVEFIKKNPNMYCGSTHNPIHLFKEIIDNPIDLLLENKVKTITINNYENGHFCVTDDGPGFPRVNVKLPDGNFQDSIIASLTKPHSGSKFDSKVAQHGQNGVGTMVVNALSNEMHILVRNFQTKNTVFHYFFRDAKFISQVEEKNIETWSTKVEFKVNPIFFETTKINENIIIDRLFLIKSIYSDCNIFYNNNEIQAITAEQFAREKLDISDETPIFCIAEKDCQVFFTYDLFKSKTCVVIGDVNLNICDGSFSANFTTLFYNVVNSYIDNEKITRSDILSNLRVYMSLNVINARFDSQTKTRLVSNVSAIVNTLKVKLLNVISNTKFFTDYFSLIVEEKAKLNAAKVLKGTKSRVSSSNPLKDCLSIPGKILYIVEGESAGGTLMQIRNKKTEAIFPLTGKILNSIDKSIDKAVESKKIKFLLEAIGVDLSKKTQTDFRYEEIKIIADADSISAETEIVYINNQGLIRCQQIQHINDITSVMSFNENTEICEVKKVRQIISHKYNKSEICQIQTVDNYNIDCTDDHVIYVYNKETLEVEQLSPSEIDITKYHLIRSIYLPTIDNKEIYFNILELSIQLIPDISYLIGRFLEYGYVAEQIINIPCKKFIHEILTSCDILGYNVSINQLNNEIQIKSLELYSIIKYLNLLENKNIPEILLSFNRENRIELIRGLCHSTGIVFKLNNRFIFETNNTQLIHILSILLKQLGFSTCIYNNKLQIENTEHINDHFEIVKIKTIIKKPYDYDVVYDLEVEDNNNFTTGLSGAIYHNSDGKHIVTLTSVALLKYANSLIKNRKVVVVLPPLYGATKGKNFIPIYNFSDVAKYESQGYNVTRFKGLGEMNPSQLKEIVYNSPREYIINPPKDSSEGEIIIKCLTDTHLKRTICKDERFGIERLLSLITNS